MNKPKLPRRDFLSTVLKTGATVALFPQFNAFAGPMIKNFTGPSKSSNAQDDDAHFFLFITLPDPSGVDFTYLFDSRPMEMTANNILQNYRTPGEPTPWVGANGTSTLMSDMTLSLQALRPYFSVINGVSMSPVDGHDQNINYLYSGSTFGGESFIPHLNRVRSERPLDILQRGPVRATILNSERTVPLNPNSASALVQKLKAVPPFDPNSELFQHLTSRFLSAAQLDTNGAFSIGAAKMQTGFESAPALSNMIEELKISEDDTNANFVNMIGQFFKVGAVRSAVLSLVIDNAVYDTHDTENAKKQPGVFKTLVDSLAEILNGLRNTQYDDKRSLMDVTTFMFSAEFSRTMRQYGRPIDDTGTDHNQFCNSILIGGRGVVPGQVIGSSDIQVSTEQVSPAHLSFDRAKLKIFGKPFDFKTFQPRIDLPTTYVGADYINFNSVANTIYKLFSVPETRYRLIERNAPVAPILSPLLK